MILSIKDLIILFLICSCLLEPAMKARGQELNLGVPQVEGSSNILLDRDPFADFIRHSIVKPMINLKKESGFSLELADSASLSADGRTVTLRLRSASTFVNGQLAGSADIRKSLHFCLSRQAEKDRPDVKAEDKNGRVIISVSSQGSADGPDNTDVLKFLAGCMIMSSESLDVFGSETGDYNLVVGTGPYLLASRIKNREARLERYANGSAWAKVINVRSLKDSDHGLTALRTGTLDLFYTQDDAVLARAAEDPTLLIVECGVYKVIHRKGLLFECLPRLEPEKIRYLNE